jgi:hypothetical protein
VTFTFTFTRTLPVLTEHVVAALLLFAKLFLILIFGQQWK